MHDNIFDMMVDEAEALADVNVEDTKTLSEHVRRLRQLEDDIDAQEAHLKQLKAEKLRYQREILPSMMDEMGIERLDVEDVTLQRNLIVSASIPVARREEAYQWLRDHGHDSIIKNDVVVSFGKGEDNIAGDTFALLEERGLHPAQKTSVHSSTLKAWVKEQVTKGGEIDVDLFGAYLVNAAEIKRK